MEKLIGCKQKVTRAMQARVEDYPDLKNNKVIYNTRIQSFPDLMLAKLFRFRAATQMT